MQPPRGGGRRFGGGRSGGGRFGSDGGRGRFGGGRGHGGGGGYRDEGPLAEVVGECLPPPPLEEVFENLRCNREGLSSTQAEHRLAIFGPNKLEEKKESKFLKFLGFMWNPLS